MKTLKETTSIFLLAICMACNSGSSGSKEVPVAEEESLPITDPSIETLAGSVDEVCRNLLSDGIIVEEGVGATTRISIAENSKLVMTIECPGTAIRN